MTNVKFTGGIIAAILLIGSAAVYAGGGKPVVEYDYKITGVSVSSPYNIQNEYFEYAAKDGWEVVLPGSAVQTEHGIEVYYTYRRPKQ